MIKNRQEWSRLDKNDHEQTEMIKDRQEWEKYKQSILSCTNAMGLHVG